VSHKLGGRLPLLSARHAVTPSTLKRAATNFAAWWTEAQWVWTVCLRQRRDCDSNPRSSEPESSTLPLGYRATVFPIRNEKDHRFDFSVIQHTTTTVNRAYRFWHITARGCFRNPGYFSLLIASLFISVQIWRSCRHKFSVLVRTHTSVVARFLMRIVYTALHTATSLRRTVHLAPTILTHRNNAKRPHISIVDWFGAFLRRTTLNRLSYVDHA